MYAAEEAFIVKYTQGDMSSFAMPYEDLGIDVDAELANQYQYTKDIVTDSEGNLKGVSWQGCPGVLIYNREAAKEVLKQCNNSMGC